MIKVHLVRYWLGVFCFFLSVDLWAIPKKLLIPDLTYSFNQSAKTHLESGQGGVQIQSQKVSIKNRLSYISLQKQSFNWSNAEKLPFKNNAEPVNKLQRLAVGASWMQPFENGRLLSSLGLVSTSESGNLNFEGVSLTNLFLQRLSAKQTLVYGIVLGYHPVDSNVIPAVGLSYNVHSHQGWSYVIGFPRIYVGYAWPDGWKSTVGLYYEDMIGKLTINNQVEPNGYLETERMNVELALHKSLLKNLNAKLIAYVSPFDRLSLYDQNGHRIQSHLLVPHAGLSFQVQYFF